MKQSLIIFFSFFCFTVCIQAEQNSPRIVHFPEDQAVGRLMIRDIGPGQHYTVLFGWELLGQAQGDVIIPEGKELKLEIYRDITDISFISKIKPNDLESLSLSRTNIVDEDFVHLKDLTGLLALDISSMKQINGSGLAYLADLKSLKELSCFNTGIEDSALEHISKFHSLERLTLYWTRINAYQKPDLIKKSFPFKNIYYR